MHRHLAATLAFVALSACTNPAPRSVGRDPETATFKNLPPLLELCAASEQLCGTAPRVEIFEGLPHTMFEAELLAREKRRPDVFLNHDFYFYAPAMALPQADRQKLLAGVVSQSSFVPWGGPKFCGGFHPDLLIRFHHPETLVDVHLCFGCGEAISYAPESRAHVDIKESLSPQWNNIQKRNRKKRPLSEISGVFVR